MTNTAWGGYSNQYSGVLDNISKITYAKDNALPIAQTVVNMCNLGGDIASSGHQEIVDNMEAYAAEIVENIGDDPKYSDIRSKADTFANEVNKYVATYREITGICGDKYNIKAKDQATALFGQAPFLASSAERLLAEEVSRSEEVEKEISKAFTAMISFTVIFTVIVVILTLVISILITRSITKPIEELKGKIGVLADGDLTVQNIKVKGTNEIGQLGTAFNKMKNSLSTVINKVQDGARELELATNTVTISIEENSLGSNRIAKAVEEMFMRLQQQKNAIDSIVEKMAEVECVSNEVALNARHISESATGAEQNAKIGVQKISAYVEQILESSDQNVTEINEISAIVAEEAANQSEVSNTTNKLLDLTRDLETVVLQFKI